MANEASDAAGGALAGDVSDILTGRTRRHLAPVPGTEVLIHQEALPAWNALREKAGTEGFDLRICSGFRDFERQLWIWNRKALGQRPLYDAQGTLLEFSRLSPPEIMQAILTWSALPGASRHHWGTDIDVYDARALPEGGQPQLTRAEVEGSGIFAPLHDWLDGELAAFDFFRPYARDLGGVSPERWHLSYAPLSEPFLAAYGLPLLESVIRGAALELQAVVLAHLPEIYERYVRRVSAR